MAFGGAKDWCISYIRTNVIDLNSAALQNLKAIQNDSYAVFTRKYRSSLLSRRENFGSLLSVYAETAHEQTISLRAPPFRVTSLP